MTWLAFLYQKDATIFPYIARHNHHAYMLFDMFVYIENRMYRVNGGNQLYSKARSQLS